MNAELDKELRVLILEDVATDAELIERALRKAGLHFRARRVDRKDSFERALDEFEPDIVLSDYNLPDINGLMALKIAQEKCPDVPVIEVTGALGDEAAVELVRAGAKDYVLKDRLARLPFAVQHALSEAKEARQRKKAEEALRRSEEKFRGIVETSSDWIWETDESGAYSYVSPRVKQLLGFEPEELVGKRYSALMPATEAARVAAMFENIKEQHKAFALLEYRITGKDGREVVIETSGVPIFGDDGSFRGYRGIDRDVTERKQAQRALERLNRMLRTLSSANQSLVHAKSEPELLRDMCQVLIDVGGYRMAWIGLAEHDEAKSVRVAAVAGHNDGYAEQARVSWADNDRGCGPTGTAIRTGEPQLNLNFATDPRMGPWRAEALKRGYASSAALPLRDVTGVFGALTIYAREPEAIGPGELDLFIEMAGDLAYGIAALRAGSEREAAVRQLYDSLEDTVGAIASTIEMRDPYTAGHQRRVAKLAATIAGEMGLPQDQARGIFLAGLIHDVGKIHIPAEILSKPGKLTALEMQFIQTHAQAGYDIIKGVEFPWPIAEAVLQHHERLDGSGYPRGLVAEAVIVEARILAVADVTEAIMAHRPYRPALGLDAALAEIESGKGRLYDPAAVDACIVLFRNKGFAFG